MLPGSRHLLFCGLYFFIALPVVVGLAPGGGEITANPTFVGWVFVLAASVLHLAFMGGLAYRWIVVEPFVPEEPVPRRTAAAHGSPLGGPRVAAEAGGRPAIALVPTRPVPTSSLVDCAFAGVPTPSTHARGSRPGSRPGFGG